LKWLIVQLQGRAKIHGRTWGWLHDGAAFPIRKLDDSLYISFVIFVDRRAAFSIQYLVQAFLRTRLLRRFLTTGEQLAWPCGSDYYGKKGSNPMHDGIIVYNRSCRLSNSKTVYQPQMFE
jgi:hypothetical protein